MTTTPHYLDAARPIAERVEALLGQMTLVEKCAQIGSYWVYELLDGITLSPEKAVQKLKDGIGQITRIGGASNVRPAESAHLANSIQRWLLENTRLKIPAVVHEECCSGYMARGATVFPQAIGVASTWEPELVQAMGDIIRQQMRSVGGHHALAPVLDVTRDARWGRVEETFGEDPYLVSRMGVAYVKGIQGEEWRDGIIATGKHFVGYGMTEGGMNWSPAHIAPRELRELYLHPFEAAVREAKLGSMMNGYHELDGIPCGANKQLLTDILRDEWGFDGTVVSDYFAVTQLFVYHHIARDKAEAARIALEAGMDVELPGSDSYAEPLRAAVERGDIKLELVDRAVRRQLKQKFELGLFEKPYVDAGVVVFDTPDQRKVARELAQKSIILLKNANQQLPLKPNLASIAVIGPNADSVRNLFGDYAYPAHIETLMEMTKAEKNFAGMPVPDKVELAADFIKADSILQAIRARVSPQTQIHYAQGCDVRTPRTDGFAEAVAAAKAAQVAIVVVGDKGGLTDDSTSGEARDRAILSLPGVQPQLVQAICETGTPVVLVLVNGRPVTLDGLVDSAAAIVEVWFPGEEGAQAVTEVLFGDVNPGGKLPISFPLAVGQLPVFYSHRPSGGRSNWKIDYVETPVSPQFPFGFGLSYTRFSYSNLSISPASAKAGETIRVSLEVQNTGERDGDEVVQLYTHQYVPYVTRPVKELKGFKRLTLTAGEKRTVTFQLSVNQQGFYDRDMQFVVEPGAVDVMVGSSSQDIHLTGSFTISGERQPVAKTFFSQAE